jgi:hypothetical protein
MKVCKICKEEFENNSLYANHIRWKHKDTQYSEEGLKNMRKELQKRHNTKHGIRIYESVVCYKENCDNVVDIVYREGKKKEKNFCSRSCANSRVWSKEVNDQRSKNTSMSIKKLWKDNKSFRKRQLNRKRFYTSKGEREIVDHFKNNHPNITWKTGGGLKYKDEILVRDLWVDDLKISLEYDGIWHFKDIHNQLEKKQFKDKLMNEYCENNNFLLIRVKEEFYLKDKLECLRQVENLFFSSKKGIIYLYDT